MRNCEYIGNPAMFRSRVSGLGSIEPGGRSPYGDMFDNIISNYTGRGIDPRPDGGSRLTVCHSQSPAGTCKPPDWMPPVAVPDAPAKPTGFSLPLLLGAAYLLLA